MTNWKTPRPLENRLEVDRRKRPNQLYASHVIELNKFVETIQESKYGNMSVPWFDPVGAGINARVLFLLQDPSNVAEKGTGFISPDNPDSTADNTTYFRNKAGLLSGELIHWNIVPWAINGRKTEEEIKKAKPFLEKVITLLPKLEVVVCMGVHATNGWNQAYPNNQCIPGWKLLSEKTNSSVVPLTCPHPSAQSINGYHPQVDGFSPIERIVKTLENVRKILDRRL